MKKIRFTIRRLMIIVAVVALLIPFSIWTRRMVLVSLSNRAEAAKLLQTELMFLNHAIDDEKTLAEIRSDRFKPIRTGTSESDQLIDEHVALGKEIEEGLAKSVEMGRRAAAKLAQMRERRRRIMWMPWTEESDKRVKP